MFSVFKKHKPPVGFHIGNELPEAVVPPVHLGDDRKAVVLIRLAIQGL
jgi:hypothetical protein